MKIPLTFGHYEYRSKAINSQQYINMIPFLDRQGGENELTHIPRPGLLEWVDLGVEAEIRGMYYLPAVGRVIVACGNTIYDIIVSTKTVSNRGTLETTTGKVWFAENGTQLMIADLNKEYIFNIGTPSLTEITDLGAIIVNSLTYQDSYFIVSQQDTSYFYISASGDGLTWDLTDRIEAQGQPDDTLGVISDHREIWVIGQSSTEVFYNTGETFPFARIEGAFLEVGTSSENSIQKEDNTIFWLGDDGFVYRAVEYSPKIISTRQVEYQISLEDITTARSFTYRQEGKQFYCLFFPGGRTFVYDIETESWLNFTSYPSQGRWRANCAVNANDTTLVGDFENGKIYELSLSTYTDNLETIQREITTRPIAQERKRIYHERLEIHVETGVGIASGQGSDPQVMMQYSDDDGHTWSNELWRSLSKIGAYGQRVYWNRLGQSRNRIYKFKVSDPVNFTIVSAHIEASIEGV